MVKHRVADDKVRESVIQASTVAGGLGGATIGGAVGSLVCGPAVYLGFGTLILIFSVLGAVFSSWSAEIIYDEAQEFTSWNII